MGGEKMKLMFLTQLNNKGTTVVNLSRMLWMQYEKHGEHAFTTIHFDDEYIEVKESPTEIMLELET